jgi:hypothetical protein
MTKPKKKLDKNAQDQEVNTTSPEGERIGTTTHLSEIREVDVTDTAEIEQPLGADEQPEEQVKIDLPEELTILPLRGLVVYPQTTIPLTIGQPRSIKLVDEAVAGDRLIGLVASKDPDLERPSPIDI